MVCYLQEFSFDSDELQLAVNIYLPVYEIMEACIPP
jgi:hypothetical protein